MSKETQYLARSVLLEESGNPLIARSIVWFVALTIVAFLGWASIAEIDEVARADGEVSVIGNIKEVQHPQGGVIADILVNEGDIVTQGQTLMRLDNAIHTSNLEKAKIEKQSLTKQRSLLQEEIDMRETLFRKGLNSKALILSLQRRMNEIENGLLTAEETIRQASHALRLTNITAPEFGTVHGLSVHTAGGVVSPGQIIAEIVPSHLGLLAEIRISPQDIGHVQLGHPVTIKFTTFDYARYGGLLGTLDELSGSSFLDENGKTYFRGVVRLPAAYIERHGIDYSIIPGMTLTADIRTGSKTVLEYLLKPIFTSASTALQER